MNKPSFKVLEIAINALKEQDKKEARWQKTFNEMFDGHIIPTYNNTLFIAIMNMLKEVFHDEYDWIAYWVWEGEYGKKARIWENKKEIPVKDLKDFYDFLIKEYFSKEKTEELKEPTYYNYNYTINVPEINKKEYNPAEEFFKITC